MPKLSLEGESSEFVYVEDVLISAIAVMEQFGPDFLPSDTCIVERALLRPMGNKFEELITEASVQANLKKTMATWPPEFVPVFLQASSSLAQLLNFINTGRDEIGFPDVLLLDPDIFRLLEALDSTPHDTEVASDKFISDYTGHAVFEREICKRIAFYNNPLPNLITTLLGGNAFSWLSADSDYGLGKLQPHEFSRSEWWKLWSIKSQIDIEQELLEFSAGGEQADSAAKIVVVLCWTLAALASFISPQVFIGEHEDQICSSNRKRITFSNGIGTNIIIEFKPSAMLKTVRILAKGLMDPLLSAPDLMWIGAGLASVCKVKSGFSRATAVEEESYSFFLSHRGLDVKSSLVNAVQALGKNHQIFLDCLVLPRGVVNRSFVFGSLTKAKRILIVDSENFQTSEWCKKEAWLADEMHFHKMAITERLSLRGAIEVIGGEGNNFQSKPPKSDFSYSISNRIISDNNNWMRAPNLHSLKEAGHSTHSIDNLIYLLNNNPNPGSVEWQSVVGREIYRSLEVAYNSTPDATPVDLLSTTIQFAAACISVSSFGRSKAEVRQVMDNLDAALTLMIREEIFQEATFKLNAAGYLGVVTISAVLKLVGFNLDPRMGLAVEIALGGIAVLRSGVVLLDAQVGGSQRDFNLRFIVILLKSNLSGVGIVQSASDEVHNMTIDGLPLSIIPCVTLYPGMKSPFIKE